MLNYQYVVCCAVRVMNSVRADDEFEPLRSLGLSVNIKKVRTRTLIYDVVNLFT